MSELNHEYILTIVDELNKLNEYIPIVLHRYINTEDYFDRISRDVELEYYQTRTRLQGADNPSKFLEEDVQKWLKKHPQYQSILL